MLRICPGYSSADGGEPVARERQTSISINIPRVAADALPGLPNPQTARTCSPGKALCAAPGKSRPASISLGLLVIKTLAAIRPIAIPKMTIFQPQLWRNYGLIGAVNDNYLH
jgi:hypothetical protein